MIGYSRYLMVESDWEKNKTFVIITIPADDITSFYAEISASTVVPENVCDLYLTDWVSN